MQSSQLQLEQPRYMVSTARPSNVAKYIRTHICTSSQHLCWMLSRAISGIDDWNRSGSSSFFGRSRQIVAQYYTVCVRLNGPDGVCTLKVNVKSCLVLQDRAILRGAETCTTTWYLPVFHPWLQKSIPQHSPWKARSRRVCSLLTQTKASSELKVRKKVLT